jgi:hypothetical protein
MPKIFDERENYIISPAFQESFGNALSSFSASAGPGYVDYPDLTIGKDSYAVHKTNEGWRYSLVGSQDG